MILMGDGSSNILNKDSIKEFDGHYTFGKTEAQFPADAFVLNPPYSASGNGMIFVKKALDMMNKGYAAIIIQGSAGSGKAKEINKEILKKHTLLASIKMPNDLFIGKSSVQTYIYVFRAKEAHTINHVVKFIDFSNDGYTRTNRKKTSTNLKDTDRAKERYEELVNLVLYGKGKEEQDPITHKKHYKNLKILTDKEYYEGSINPSNGADWNQTSPKDTKPTSEEFRKTVHYYLAREVSDILRQKDTGKEKDKITSNPLEEALQQANWKEFKYIDIFNKIAQGRRLKKDDQIPGDLPFVMAGTTNAGVVNHIANKVRIFPKHSITIDIFGNVFYRDFKFGAGDDTGVYWNDKKQYSKEAMLFLVMALEKSLSGKFSYGKKLRSSQSLNFTVLLPAKNDEIDFDFMEKFIIKSKEECISEHIIRCIAELEAYKSVLELEGNVAVPFFEYGQNNLINSKS